MLLVAAVVQELLAYLLLLLDMVVMVVLVLHLQLVELLQPILAAAVHLAAVLTQAVVAEVLLLPGKTLAITEELVELARLT